jgi:hypothetical protein
LTVDRAVISLTKNVKVNGLAYVAISRVRKLSGLFLSHFDEDAIRTDVQFKSIMNILRQYEPDHRPAVETFNPPVDAKKDGHYRQTAVATRAHPQPTRTGATPHIPVGTTLYQMTAANMTYVKETVDGIHQLIIPLDDHDVNTTVRYNGWMEAPSIDSFLQHVSNTSLITDNYRNTRTLGTEFNARWMFPSDSMDDQLRLNSASFQDVVSNERMDGVALITIPLNYSDRHWTMVVVDIEQGNITLFDSSDGSRHDSSHHVLERVRQVPRELGTIS